MPDWKRLVRKRMAPVPMPPAAKNEVIAELAIHLEEAYDHARSTGVTERAAIKLALQEVHDWRVLSAEIRAARSPEGSMNHRTKSLWLPALASFTAASLFLLALTEISRQPRFLVQLNSGLGRSLYVGWVVAQLLFGAIGAFLSRRSGGTRAARLIAGTFPALVMFGLCAVWIPISAVVEHNAFVLAHPDRLAIGILIWVIPPAITLFLGALPFLRGSAVA